MGNKLAIHGHPRRGKEVIELLEMMGGNNIHNLSGDDSYAYYVIEGCQNEIRAGEYIFGDEDMCFLTLEDFWEEYPFKVGDKVTDKYGDTLIIKSMSWSEDCETMVYDFEDSVLVLVAEDLKVVDDDSNNTLKNMADVYSISECKTIGQGTYAIKIADGYKFDSVDENGNIIVKSIKSTYPKTFKECRAILNYSIGCISGYKSPLLANLQDLLVCRDTYWQIAGKEMGLDKPWESPLPSLFETVHCIRRKNNEIIKGSYRGGKSEILEFPTEEMRDAFCENFKDLIERCKEIL